MEVDNLSVDGDTKLHTFVRKGDTFHLEEELKLNTTALEAKNSLSHTPMYVACEKGEVACVKMLLGKGACLKYTHHGDRFSCLNAAIDANRREVVMTILTLPRDKWKDAFKFCNEVICDQEPQSRCGIVSSDNIWSEEITPLRKLIKKMPGVARVVFDKLCDSEAIQADYLYREFTYDYELLEDYQDLYSELPNRQQQGEVDQCCRKDSTWGPRNFKYQTHPLHLMVRYKRKDLLGHELVTSFLCMRWNMFLKYFYYINLLSYIILMLLLTVYVHIFFVYATNYSELTNQTLNNCSDVTFSDVTSTDMQAPNFTLMRVMLITVSAVISAICLFRIFTEVTQMLSNPREYFGDFLNYVELFLYFSTIAFVTNGNFMCLTGWRWEVGALCIFFSWLNFVFFLRLQPNLGIYVIMFEEIIATFLKVLPLALLLILAFGQPFFILLGPITHESDPRTRPFSSLHYSLMKTLTMMIGEFENDPLFYSVPNVLFFPFSTYFVWIIFVIVMSVLFQNLLVGLAVDNIKGIRKQAEFKRQVAQVKVLLSLMSSRLVNFKKLLSYCMKHQNQPTQYTKTQGKLRQSLLENFKHKLSNLINFAWKPEEPVFLPKKKKLFKLVRNLWQDSRISYKLLEVTGPRVSEAERKILERLDVLTRMIQQLSQKIDHAS